METLEKRHIIIFWSGFYYESGGRKIFAKDNVFSMHLKKGKTALFTKVFFIKHFPWKEDHSSYYKRETLKIFQRAFHKDFSVLIKDHIKMWDRFWRKTDILINGEGDIQQNLRFNI
ncbi:MAG: hypothetical protein ACOYU0_06940 [Nitrospirota bacterium]